jgi:hypothetical protein
LFYLFRGKPPDSSESDNAKARDGKSNVCDGIPRQSRHTPWGMAQQSDQAVHEAALAGLTDKLAEMLAMDRSLHRIADKQQISPQGHRRHHVVGDFDFTLESPATTGRIRL